ncbi:MAG: helix-turn-helix transcriptional regulator [Bacteroidales bacterium]|nr:helix-turn-helix transcriptional regulator [Bacteroidales bacterium]
MVDFHKREIIIGSLSGKILAGIPASLVRKEGFKVYDKILSKAEKRWLLKMNSKANEIFRSYSDPEMRMELVLSYDLKAKAPDGREVILHHRLVPYQFDDNGNLWLALCTISALPLTNKLTKASIECIKTGERYDYVDDEFVSSEYKTLTEDEISILGYLADGVALKQIGEKIGISLRAVERKKQSALGKLGAPTQASAVYRAKSIGLI